MKRAVRHLGRNGASLEREVSRGATTTGAGVLVGFMRSFRKTLTSPPVEVVLPAPAASEREADEPHEEDDRRDDPQEVQRKAESHDEHNDEECEQDDHLGASSAAGLNEAGGKMSSPGSRVASRGDASTDASRFWPVTVQRAAGMASRSST